MDDAARGMGGIDDLVRVGNAADDFALSSVRAAQSLDDAAAASSRATDAFVDAARAGDEFVISADDLVRAGDDVFRAGDDLAAASDDLARSVRSEPDLGRFADDLAAGEFRAGHHLGRNLGDEFGGSLLRPSPGFQNPFAAPAYEQIGFGIEQIDTALDVLPTEQIINGTADPADYLLKLPTDAAKAFDGTMGVIEWKVGDVGLPRVSFANQWQERAEEIEPRAL